jgi:hypothetical protein
VRAPVGIDRGSSRRREPARSKDHNAPHLGALISEEITLDSRDEFVEVVSGQSRPRFDADELVAAVHEPKRDLVAPQVRDLVSTVMAAGTKMESHHCAELFGINVMSVQSRPKVVHARNRRQIRLAWVAKSLSLSGRRR